jgi:hypothetical protein
LALAPHGGSSSLTWLLLLVAVAGLLLSAWWARVWIQVNLRPAASAGSPGPYAQAPWQGAATLTLLIAPYLGVLAAALLVATRHPEALGVLAISTAALLVLGTVAAWIMLSHAGTTTDAPGQPDS